MAINFSQTSLINWKVKAIDGDSGRYGSVRYTNVHGEHAKALLLDPITGILTVASASLLDRETSPGFSNWSYIFLQHLSIKIKLIDITVAIEARDNEGNGRSTSVPLLIRLLDINDNVPHFINTPYEATLTPDLSRFTSKFFVQVHHNTIIANVWQLIACSDFHR